MYSYKSVASTRSISFSLGIFPTWEIFYFSQGYAQLGKLLLFYLLVLYGWVSTSGRSETSIWSVWPSRFPFSYRLDWCSTFWAHAFFVEYVCASLKYYLHARFLDIFPDRLISRIHTYLIDEFHVRLDDLLLFQWLDWSACVIMSSHSFSNAHLWKILAMPSL